MGARLARWSSSPLRSEPGQQLSELDAELFALLAREVREEAAGAGAGAGAGGGPPEPPGLEGLAGPAGAAGGELAEEEALVRYELADGIFDDLVTELLTDMVDNEGRD